MNDCIILRYGEIGLKSQRKRPLFERFYVNAIKDALDRNGFKGYKIINLGGRFVIEHGDADSIAKVVSRVPGVQSLSPAKKLKFVSKQGLIKDVVESTAEIVKSKKFKVDVNRIGEHDFSSMEIARDIGEKLLDYSSGVSMKNPDVTVFLEVRKDECYVYTESIHAIGGLPPRSTGKFLCLFSGGIDSPVAAFRMMKRGAKADFLFINLVGDKAENDVKKIYNYLIAQYAFGYTPKLFIVDGREIVDKIKKEVEDKLRQIALKIAFYKIAENIAKENRHAAIVTGETLSQKSSQTVESLSVIQGQIRIIVIRPLICYDKVEIVRIANEIGTLGASEKVKEYCNLSEGPVSTAPGYDVIKKFPDLKDEISKALKTSRTIKGAADILPDTDIDPASMKNMKIIDLTSKREIGSGEAYSYPDVLDHVDKFNKDEAYLIVCDYGMKSESLAYILRKRGINAKGISLREYGNMQCTGCKNASGLNTTEKNSGKRG